MSIEKYCQRPAISVGPRETVRVAAERMDKEGVGCLVVVEKGRPIGVVTDRGIALDVLCRGLDAEDTRVGDVARRGAVTISKDASVAEAARKIRRHSVRRLPVVDGKGKLVGIMAADDLMRLIASELAQLGRAVDAQLPCEPEA